MRQTCGLVFDEVVSVVGISTQSTLTSTELNEQLARADAMAIQVVVSDVTAGGGAAPQVGAAIETSADGVLWATKSATQEVAYFDVVTNATRVSAYSYDASGLPSLRFVRLRVMLKSTVSTGASAHIRVWVTLRDGGGELYGEAAAKRPTQQDEDGPNNPHIYQGKPGS